MRETITKLFGELLLSVGFDRLYAKHSNVFDEITQDSKRAQLNGGKTTVVAIGKSAHEMTRQLAKSCSLAGDINGIVVTPYRPPEWSPILDWDLQLHVGGHPLPDQGSIDAAESALQLVSNSKEQDLTVFLVSGGASAAFESPISTDITIEDLQQTYRMSVSYTHLTLPTKA